MVKALRFADDQVMLAVSQEGLQRMMDRLNTNSLNYEMKINTKKTKVMKIGKRSGKTTQKIKIIIIKRIGAGTGGEVLLSG